MTSRLLPLAPLLAFLPFTACGGHADPTPVTPATPSARAAVVTAAPPAVPVAVAELTVDLAADGTTRVNGAPVTDEALQRTARAAHDANPDVRVVIHAEATVTHARTIALLDLLKQAGVTRFALAPVTATP